MTPLPLPGAKEAELVAKVGTGVLQGLRKARQPPRWPDTRDALLELHAILREWCSMAEGTRRYAALLSGTRKDPTTGEFIVATAAISSGTNVGGSYVERVVRDSRTLLEGYVPALLKLRPSTKRRAARRGLRTILGVYCPALLDQFEQATTARFNWVQEHREHFDRWFDQPRTRAEVTQLLTGMVDTQVALNETATQLREFITANFPLRDATSST